MNAKSSPIVRAPSLSFSLVGVPISVVAMFALALMRDSTSPDGPQAVIYDKALGGFRWVDILLCLSVAFTALLTAGLPKRWKLPRQIARPATLFGAAIVLAFIYGWSQGGTDLFFDWRNIVLGATLVPFFASRIRTPLALRSAVHGLIAVFTLRALWIFGAYLAGGGVDEVLQGVRTPLYDGATLSIGVLVALLAFRFSQEERDPTRRLAMLLASLIAVMLVVFCFRRTYWGELFIASTILAWGVPRARRWVIAGGGLVAILGVTLAPGLLAERVRSLNVFGETGEFAETNVDHVNDILDAWDQVVERPVTGIGLGYAYPTTRIRAWKEESWMVHNGLLHVWLRYGLLGLSAYVWYHLSLFKLVRSYHCSSQRWVRAFADVCLAYLIAQFVMPLGFTPWPYAGLQLCIVAAFLLGSLFALYPYRVAGNARAVRIRMPSSEATA